MLVSRLVLVSGLRLERGSGLGLGELGVLRVDSDCIPTPTPNPDPDPDSDLCPVIALVGLVSADGVVNIAGG